MKKNWFSIISVALVALAVGCSSGPKVYDKTVPLEESSTLMPIGEVGVIQFNEKKVAWMKSTIIPDGNHVLILRYKDIKENSVTQYDIPISHTFLAGHTYAVTATIIGGKATGQIMDATKCLLDIPLPNIDNQNDSQFEGEWVTLKNGKPGFTFAGDEWVKKNLNGQYEMRGVFLHDGINATLLTVAAYDVKKGEWYYKDYGSFGSQTIAYNGTSLMYSFIEYKKVE
jgi:hypothetical protein